MYVLTLILKQTTPMLFDMHTLYILTLEYYKICILFDFCKTLEQTKLIYNDTKMCVYNYSFIYHSVITD